MLLVRLLIKRQGTDPTMKAPKERRSAQIHILISEQEMDKIRERMAQTGITNTSAFIRKMAIDGYVINLDLSEIRELTPAASYLLQQSEPVCAESP